jgi:hypothetical protein
MKEIIVTILTLILSALIIMGVIFGIISVFSSIKLETGEQNVSGIVYNTKNNKFISGNTTFSVRAAENTPVTQENQSTFCLPPNSEYIELVNKAASNKEIKVNVKTEKVFMIAAPWYCPSYIKVVEVK